jgi:hypothetical protein
LFSEKVINQSNQELELSWSGVVVGFSTALRGQTHGKVWETSGLSCTEKTLHSGEVNTIIALQLFTMIRIWLYSISLDSIF